MRIFFLKGVTLRFPWKASTFVSLYGRSQGLRKQWGETSTRWTQGRRNWNVSLWGGKGAVDLEVDNAFMLSVAVTVLVTWNFFLYLVVFQVYDTDKDGLISI